MCPPPPLYDKLSQTPTSLLGCTARAASEPQELRLDCKARLACYVEAVQYAAKLWTNSSLATVVGAFLPVALERLALALLLPCSSLSGSFYVRPPFSAFSGDAVFGSRKHF